MTYLSFVITRFTVLDRQIEIPTARPSRPGRPMTRADSP